MISGNQNRMLGKGLAGNRPLEAAMEEFRRARQRAAIELLTSRLTGRSWELLPYEEIAAKLQARGRTERGLQDIPLNAIVGSVGRYNDFTRSFLPRHDWDAQRWASVKSAGHVADLPPIDVYQIGEIYFVLDGNHRVSIAQQLGMEYIQASVVEIHTRVPLSRNLQPDELIIKAEYTAFLAYTRLDELRPSADLHVTIPGQYDKLENHIEVHRFFIEMDEGQALTDSQAVIRWYDEAYRPLVEAIREHGILRDFPNRTETDLYLWLANHQAQLRRELGWQIRPDTAVTQLAARYKPTPFFTRAFRKVLDVVVPDGWKGQPRTDWTDDKRLDRYSGALFTEILVLLTGEDEAILDQAIQIARQENGRLVGLSITNDQKQFAHRCTAADIPYLTITDTRPLPEMIGRRAPLADLVIIPVTLFTESLLRLCHRPLLLIPAAASSLSRGLLFANTGEDSSLFAATYLAERWPTALVVVAGHRQQAVQNYLEMHEVRAEFVAETAVDPFTAATPETHACDFIIIGRQHPQLTAVVAHSSMPIFIC